MTIHFDLEVTAQSTYTPFNSSLNTLNGRFAQINLAANQQVALRATVKRSCSTADSCSICNELSSFAERIHCYGRGCSCVGVLVHHHFACGAAEKEAYRRAYDCSWASDTLVLPSTAMIGMSVFDFDGGASHMIGTHSFIPDTSPETPHSTVKLSAASLGVPSVLWPSSHM